MKSGKRLMAAVLVCAAMAGCDLPEEPIGELLGMPPVTVAAEAGQTEAPTRPQDEAALPKVGWPRTPERREEFRPGEQVYIVLHADDQAAASVIWETVVAQVDGYLVTTPGEYADNMEMVWDLVILSDLERPFLNLWPEGDCYRDRAEAEAAALEECDYV